MKKTTKSYIIFVIIIISLFFVKSLLKLDLNPEHEISDIIDSLNGVYVYYNGGVDHVEGRHMTDDYNVGLRYQCVEFVKRYYLEFYKHKMPESYGHAKSFFDASVFDGDKNTQRDLLQYTNPSLSKPRVGDLIVMDANIFNPYGHVAIISDVTENEIEIIQQNPGPFSPSREVLKMKLTKENKWKIEQSFVLGWLRK
jgi:surface antigen